MKNIPKTCIDAYGYPTDEYIEFLESVDFPETTSMVEKDRETILALITENWVHQEYTLGEGYLELHTMGWSGNETVISTLKSNTYIWNILIPPYEWRRGGHWTFEWK